MISIDPPNDCKAGTYPLVASSAQSKAEWDALLVRIPAAVKKAYERLSEHPLEPFGTRQFPLKGKRLKPIWEYEVTGSDRLYYLVDTKHSVVVLYAGKHPSSVTSMADTVTARRAAIADEHDRRPKQPSSPKRHRKR